MGERRPGELQRRPVRVAALADVIPVEDVFPDPGVPVGSRGLKRPVAISGRRGMGLSVESCRWMSGVTRPPADSYLLCVHGIAHDEVVGRRLGRLTREQADGQVE